MTGISFPEGGQRVPSNTQHFLPLVLPLFQLVASAVRFVIRPPLIFYLYHQTQRVNAPS